MDNKIIGFISDLELENIIRDFLNDKPENFFIEYMFSVKNVANLYDKYTLAVENDNTEEIEKITKQIKTSISAYYFNCGK